MQNQFYANGKLLITAEYAVLDGAQALAVPTRLGQSLQFSLSDDENGHWNSYDADGSLWFEADFSTKNYDILHTNDAKVAGQLVKILRTCHQLEAETWGHKNQQETQYKPLSIETRLTFPRQWGLGTSSTLIYNLANLFKINAFELLDRSFGGSGYDLACAGATQALLFWRDNKKPHIQSVVFQPPFVEQLYFVYLGKKQNSREGIARYRQKMQQMITDNEKWATENKAHEVQNSKFTPPQYISHFSALTAAFLTCSDLKNFEKLITEHETLVASLVELPRAKTVYFNDFWGEIKSLGAWGGDFVLATSERSILETKAYFMERGFKVVVPYQEMVM